MPACRGRRGRTWLHWERNAAIVVDMSSRRSLVGTGNDTVRLMRLEGASVRKRLV